MTEALTWKGALELLKALGEAMVILTDGIKHMVATGYAGYSEISAKRTHKRLVDFSARVTYLWTVPQYQFTVTIDDYLAMPCPREEDWLAIGIGTNDLIYELDKVLNDLRKERSDFVLESAYSKITESLSYRAAILENIYDMPQPTTEDEKEILRKINENIKKY